jgi:23S rRNA (cytidine2498-2'-O)-methyltransferase
MTDPAATASPPARLTLCRAGQEARLAEELARVLPASRHALVAPGWIGTWLARRDRDAVVAVAFAAQTVPNPAALGADSVSGLARGALEHLAPRLGDGAAPWRLHVYCRDERGAAVHQRRCDLVAEALGEQLRKRHRLLRRRLVTEPGAAWGPDEALAQIALVTPTAGFVSLCPPTERQRLRRVLSRFQAGEAPVAEDPRPPSRAYRKLLEAERHLGVAIAAGERCVDLGGSPGGWAFIGVDRGAQVTAVDRSPLRADLMAHPRLAFVQGDGFAWRPDAPLDWLLCDIIAAPERSLDLVARWAGEGLCRRFCVTIKFKGDAGDACLEAGKAALDALGGRGVDYLMRQLAHNRNEVTVLGRTDGVPVAP